MPWSAASPGGSGSFSPVEKGVAGGQRRLFELDAHTVDRWPKDVFALPGLLQDAVQGAFRFRHHGPRLHLADG
jgi:hypothetical protein